MVLGGSPVSLFRVSARAAASTERWRLGRPVGGPAGARLLARRLGPTARAATDDRKLRTDDVTVVIPVRGRPAQLDRLLHAVSGLACVVVDDASPDAGATKEIAERHGPRFVALADNCGPAGARNAGLALVHTPLVAFVDSDCVPAPGWLEPLLGPFRRPRSVRRRWSPRGPRRDAADPVQLRGGPFLAGPGDRRGPRAARLPDPLRPERRVGGAGRGGVGAGLFDPTLAGRRGRGPRLAPRRCRLGRALRPGEHRRARRPATLGEFLARRAFYGTSAAPLARPTGALAPVDVSGWSLAVWLLRRAPPRARAGRAGRVHRLLARRLRGLTRSRRRRDPDRRRRHGALRRACAVGPGAGLEPGSPGRTGLPANPARRSPCSLVPAVHGVGRRSARARAPSVPSPCTWPTMWPTAPGSGSAARWSAPSCLLFPALPGAPGSGRRPICTTNCSRRSPCSRCRRCPQRQGLTYPCHPYRMTRRAGSPLPFWSAACPVRESSTLADSLAVGLDLPIVHKDQLVHGMWRTRGRALELGSARRRAVPTRRMELWASLGVSFIAEQTFYRGVSEPDVARRLAPLLRPRQRSLPEHARGGAVRSPHARRPALR